MLTNSHNALIGHTGFVGSNLKKAYRFDGMYNSKNIQDLSGKHFDTTVCAAPSGEKWKVNLSPSEDLANINTLFNNIKKIECNKFVLISTIDILTTSQSPSYGANRKYFEDSIINHFGKKSTIIRVPGIFGPGMKKNIIHDLKNNNTDYVNLNTAYQWLHIKRLAEILNIDQTGIVELYPEPINTKELVKTFFPTLLHRCKNSPDGFHYDFKPTNKNDYFMKKAEVFKDLNLYIQNN